MPADDGAIIEQLLRSDLEWLFSGDLFAWLGALIHAT